MAGEAAVVVRDVTWRGVSVGLVDVRWRHVVRDTMAVMRSEAGDRWPSRRRYGQVVSANRSPLVLTT